MEPAPCTSTSVRTAGIAPAADPDVICPRRSPSIMSRVYGLDTLDRHPLALRFKQRAFEPLTAALDFPAGAWRDLFLGFLLARISNSRTHWPQRNSARRRIPEKCSAASWLRPLLVCPQRFVVFERLAHADGALLGGYGCRSAARP